MSNKSAAKIHLRSYDDLFGVGKPTGSDSDQVVEVLLTDLLPFKNHPFRVTDDEKMAELAESVRKYGVLTPGIVRPCPGRGYELIAGHRRKRASELAGNTRCRYLSGTVQMMRQLSLWWIRIFSVKISFPVKRPERMP